MYQTLQHKTSETQCAQTPPPCEYSVELFEQSTPAAAGCGFTGEDTKELYSLFHGLPNIMLQVKSIFKLP